MAIQKCGNCSAPLELAAIGSIQRCSYCGTENRILDPTIKEQEPAINITIESKAHLTLFPILAIFIALIGSGIAFNVLSTSSINLDAQENSRVQSQTGLATSQLSTLNSNLGWSKIDHTGMSGDHSDFDIIKNFDFAQKVAQNWSTDIQIDSIYIYGVKLDGSLDLSARDDWSVDYRFYSPTYRETALTMAKVSEEKISTEIRIKFEAGKMEALLSDRQLAYLKKKPKKDAFTPTCSTKQLLTEAQKSKDFEEAPFYKLMLQHLSSSQSKGYWRWVVRCNGCDAITIMVGSCKLR